MNFFLSRYVERCVSEYVFVYVRIVSVVFVVVSPSML